MLISALRGISFLCILWSLRLARFVAVATAGLSVLSECPKRGYIDGIPSTQNCTLSADWTQQCTDDNTTVKFVFFDARSQKTELCTVPYQKDTCTQSFTPGNSCPKCRCRCTEHNGTIRYTLFFTPTIAKYNRAAEMSCVTECSDKLFGSSLVHCVNISVSPNICYGAITPCHNGGTCQYDGNSEHGYVCKCVTGYSGRLCDTDPCEEEDNPCRNGGTCVLEKSNPELFSCTCRAEYEGNYCQYPASDTILTASRSSTASTSWTTAVVLAVGSSISFC